MTKTITAGRAAKLIGFSSKTIRKWCDSGAIKSFRLAPPVRPDRKIAIVDLIQFLKEKGVPACPGLEELLNKP